MNPIVLPRINSRLTEWAAVLCGIALIGFSALQLHAEDNKPISQQQQIIHVLNRLGYGPRPGDVDRVKQMGLGSYLQQQLHPERIDDSAVDRKLARLDVLSMSNRELYEALREDERIRRERQRAQAEAARQSKPTVPR